MTVACDWVENLPRRASAVGGTLTSTSSRVLSPVCWTLVLTLAATGVVIKFTVLWAWAAVTRTAAGGSIQSPVRRAAGDPTLALACMWILSLAKWALTLPALTAATRLIACHSRGAGSCGTLTRTQHHVQHLVR